MIKSIKTSLKTTRRANTVAAIAFLFFFTCLGASSAQAAELNYKQVTPAELSAARKKGRGNVPAPPADPHCPNGAVGPVTHEQISKPCKVDGKDGSKICYIKIQKCLSGPGEEEYSQTENCGQCMVLHHGNPGQVQSSSQD